MKKLPIIESYWVEEGRLLAGEYPGSFDPETTRRRMDAFLEAGIDTFFNLTRANELPSYENILKEEARIYSLNPIHQRFPIPDHAIPTYASMKTILDTIDHALEEGHNVYIHCWGGVGRTGTVIGCYFVRHGMNPREALAQVNSLYKTRPGDPSLPTSPESLEQMNFVLNWREK
jgi:protein-tyrosine phosphatase